jgi:RNA polymerase sigma-70 factor (ECF subfamily)
MGISFRKENKRLGQAPVTRLHSMTEARPPTGPAEPQTLAIGEIFAAYHQRVSCWVRRLGGPQIEVDDAVQEVFLLAHQRLRWFSGREQLLVWLYRVTENVVRHQRRRLRRRREIVGETSQHHDLSQVPWTGDASDEENAKREAMRVIYQVLDRMSERSRSLIVLFELEELSGQEIADLKGAKLATIWVWLHRARAEFRRHLAEIEGSGPRLLETTRR